MRNADTPNPFSEGYYADRETETRLPPIGSPANQHPELRQYTNHAFKLASDPENQACGWCAAPEDAPCHTAPPDDLCQNRAHSGHRFAIAAECMTF